MGFLWLLFFLLFCASPSWAAIPPGAISDVRYGKGFLVCDYYNNVNVDTANDATNGINACIEDAYNNQLAAYLEGCGEYLISNTLKAYEWVEWNTAKDVPRGPPAQVHVIRGNTSCADNDRPTIKLMASSTGFTSAGAPRPMLAVRNFEGAQSSANTNIGLEPSQPLGNPTPHFSANGSGGSVAFYETVSDINFHTNGNAGAIGIVMSVAQGSGIYNSTITATGSYAGIVGLPGRGGLTLNVDVTGGTYCIRRGTGVPGSGIPDSSGPVIVGLTCTNQTGNPAILLDEDSPHTVVGFTITKSSAGPAIQITESGVYADGVIMLSGAAAPGPAIDNVGDRNIYLREIWVSGTNNLVRSNGVTTTDNGVGTWSKIVEYTYNDQYNHGGGSTDPLVYPAYIKGVNHFESRSILFSGSTWAVGGATLPIPNPVANNVAAPPSDLRTRHVPAVVPSFADAACTSLGGPEDPRTDGAQMYVDLTYDRAPQASDVDSTTALQDAINRANTEGHGCVIIPRGNMYISGPITLYANTKLMGAGPRISAISYHASWLPTAAVFMLTTPSLASATTYVGFLTLFTRIIPEANDFITFLKWRAGKDSMTMALQLLSPYLGEYTAANGFPKNKARILMEVSGAGGGRHYMTTHTESGKGLERNVGSRVVKTISNTQPLTFYGCNLEFGKQKELSPTTIFEITGSTAGIRCWGIKREGSSTSAIITNSSNIGFFGTGALSHPPKEAFDGLFSILGTSTNITVGLIVPRQTKDLPNGEVMIHDEQATPDIHAPPWPNSISIYKKGTLDDSPFADGAEPPPNPPIWASTSVSVINTVDNCFSNPDGLTLLPATAVTGFTFLINTVAQTPTGTVRTGPTCFRSTFAGGLIDDGADAVVVSYTPGNVTSTGPPTVAATAFSGKTATNALGGTVPVLTMTRWAAYNCFGDLETSPVYQDENTTFNVPKGARFVVRMKVVNTVAQAVNEALYPYVEINGAAAVPLPDTCTGVAIAFADAPAFSSGAPIEARRLTQDQATFTPGAAFESFTAPTPITWAAFPSETEYVVPIQTCLTATTGQTFRIHLYRAGGIPFATYNDAITPFFDVVTARHRSQGGKATGGGARQ